MGTDVTLYDKRRNAYTVNIMADNQSETVPIDRFNESFDALMEWIGSANATVIKDDHGILTIALTDFNAEMTITRKPCMSYDTSSGATMEQNTCDPHREMCEADFCKKRPATSLFRGSGRTKTPVWISTGRKTTLPDGSVRALYRNAAHPGELRVRRMRRGRDGRTSAVYVKPPAKKAAKKGKGAAMGG